MLLPTLYPINNWLAYQISSVFCYLYLHNSLILRYFSNRLVDLVISFIKISRKLGLSYTGDPYQPIIERR